MASYGKGELRRRRVSRSRTRSVSVSDASGESQRNPVRRPHVPKLELGNQMARDDGDLFGQCLSGVIKDLLRHRIVFAPAA